MAKFSKVTTTITRPATTTQATANDVIGSSSIEPIIFYDVVENTHNGGMIIDAVCINDKNNATRPNARLYLFDIPIAGTSDSGAFAPSDDEVKGAIGYVDFSTWHEGTSSTSGNSMSFASNLNMPFMPIDYPGSSSAPANKRPVLYGQLVERGTYTPNALENFTIRLGILRE